MSPYVHALWLFSLLAGVAFAVPSNRTIDDTYGDSITGVLPFYDGAWSSCTNSNLNCVLHPDSSDCFNGTWHEEVVDPPSVNPALPYFSLTFTGTAIYVFAVVPNTVAGAPVLNTNVTFALNNAPAGTYLHTANFSSDYQYDAPIYVNGSLPNGQYTLQVEVQAGSYLAFDYAIYTSDDSSTSVTGTPTTSGGGSLQTSTVPGTSTPVRRKTSSIGAIVGGVVGGLAAIAIIILTIVCLRRRARRNDGSYGRTAEVKKIDPFLSEKSPDPFAWEPSLTNAQPSSNLRPNRRPSSPSQPSGSSSSFPSPSGSPCGDTSVDISSAPTPTPIASTATGTGAASAALSTQAPSRVRYQMAAQRLRELARHVRQLEEEVESLNAEHAAEQAPPAPADAALRAQMDTLQQDMERMRAEQEELRQLMAMDPPPAYIHPPEGPGPSVLTTGAGTHGHNGIGDAG